MEDIQQYQYTPLLEPDAFRVIVIHPALSIESPLSCSLIYSTLFHYDQSLIDHYIALSYVWGDANKRKTILVDQKPLLINASLDSALRHLRDKKEDLAVWADGICINQFDFKEKNKQVGLMSLIYQVARHTVIFLGETTSETDEIFKLLDSPMSTMSKQTKSGFLSNARKSYTAHQKFVLHSEVYTRSKIDDLIRQVIDMPWFRRIWILQELILSGDPWIQVGFHRLRWTDFTSLILDSKHDSALVKSPNYNVLNDMRMLRESFISATPDFFGPCDYLLNILHSRRGYGVFDPRDMLYGHLALFANQSKSDNPEIEKLVEVDYRKSIADVYTDLTLYILNRQCDFKFLSHVEDGEFEEKKFNLRIHDMRDIHVVLGEKAVLGCIGTRVGGVEVIKNGIPRRKDVLALCRKIKELRGMESSRKNPITADQRIPRLVCEHFCAWFNTSETSPHHFISKDLEKLFKPEYPGAVYSFFERMELVSKIADPADLEPLKNYSEVLEDLRHPKHLWLYIVMAMTDVSGNFFSGKKLAVLRNKEIALVSMWTEVGDEIWRFDGKEERSYCVFRGFDGDEGAGLIEKKEKDGEEGGEKDGRAELDRRFEVFFREKKKQSMERYVECRDDGRIAWNKKILKTNANLSFMGDSAHKNVRNSLMRAAQVLAKLESEMNDDGKRKREKELKENLKRKMEIVVGNVLKEMHDKPRRPFLARIHHDQLHEITDGDVTLLKTDVDRIGIGMERRTVKHVRFVGECVFGVESMPCGSNDRREYRRMMIKEDSWGEKKCQEVEEEMKKWWKLGLGIPSEDLHDEREYNEDEYDEGYKGLGYDLEGWEPELKDLKVTSSNESSSKETQGREERGREERGREERGREKRYLEARRWKRLVQPLQHEILAIH
ncbi:hypothetical protein BGAL_0321g00150 [Botrytis galanthina]|uniref:Heterokaryon incompatibility domain-containing protein n=1 Tax=Botrytis galanthina TaxID=278940 RepID=A0A4S8QRB0_9HELO|nr:hypothetical protein BGAL_0321g00150 [Botrytis galanthina]